MKLKAEIILAELNKVIAMVPSDQGIIIAMRYGAVKSWAGKSFSVTSTRMLKCCLKRRYAREFLMTLSPAEEKDKNMLREIVMPYLERQIAAAEKE